VQHYGEVRTNEAVFSRLPGRAPSSGTSLKKTTISLAMLARPVYQNDRRAIQKKDSLFTLEEEGLIGTSRPNLVTQFRRQKKLSIYGLKKQQKAKLLEKGRIKPLRESLRGGETMRGEACKKRRKPKERGSRKGTT